MTESDQMASEPVPFAGELLDRCRHVCAFVVSRNEEHRILDPFVTEGIAHGEKLVYLVDRDERTILARHFQQHLGLDMPKMLSQRRFEFRTWSETYLRNGRFDQDAMLGLLDELLGAGSTRIRLVAEMGWAAGQPDLSERLVEFEARANFIQARYNHVVICVYDAAKFGGDVMIDMLRTHPFVLIGGVVQTNPFFVPPAEFLEELRSRRQGD